MNLVLQSPSLPLPGCYDDKGAGLGVGDVPLGFPVTTVSEMFLLFVCEGEDACDCDWRFMKGLCISLCV